MRTESNVSLKARTTLNLGGVARSLTTVDTEEDLALAASEARRAGTSLFVLGGGSNLVVGDDGCDERLVSLAMKDVTVASEEDNVRLVVSAGHDWDALVGRATEEGWSGLECLSGIPGSVGATPIQNVGAYGQEVADTISRVRVFDQEEGTFSWWSREACGFAYRSSHFRFVRRRIVTAVEFVCAVRRESAPIRYAELAKALSVTAGERAPIDLVRKTVLELRRGKGMVWDKNDPESVSAGSFFTNPLVSPKRADEVERIAEKVLPRFPGERDNVKLPAAWLVEAAGFAKGFSISPGASVSRKHALALVNRGGTTAELLALARTIRNGVDEKFGVRLEPEPIFLGCSL